MKKLHEFLDSHGFNTPSEKTFGVILLFTGLVCFIGLILLVCMVVYLLPLFGLFLLALVSGVFLLYKYFVRYENEN